jgi:hypothetical protein
MADAPLPEIQETDTTTAESVAFVDAIAQAVVAKLQAQTEPEPQIPSLVLSFPRYRRVIQARKVVSAIALGFCAYALANCFVPLLPWANLITRFGLAIGAIASGLALVILLVSEVFRGAGIDQEIQWRHGERTRREYQFIPSLHRFTFVLLLLALGFATIITGYATLYTELVRHNPASFDGLEPGFLAIYFSLVTFSTVGYGDIFPVAVGARLTAVCEIFMAMFFSLVVISTTLSWVSAHERQQQELSVKERIRIARANTAANDVPSSSEI